MTDQDVLPALPAGVGADARTTVTFLTGAAADGSVSPIDGNEITFGEPPHKWQGGAAGSGGGTVTYGFAPGAAFTAADEGFIASALALWSAVANITFVPAGSATPHAVFDASKTGSSQTMDQTSGDASGSTLAQTTSGNITIDTSVVGWKDLSSFSVAGGYGPHTVIHEIGHLLGFSHTGNYNMAVAPADQYNATDSQQWSIMSYFDPALDCGQAAGQYASQYSITGTQWGISADGYAQVPQTWMPLDILAAQRLYGVAVNTPLSGGQVFGFNSNIQGAVRQFFDFTQNATPILTLWDKGGGNTLDLSGFTSDATVNLNPGTFSSADGLVDNIGIAYGTAIDRVVASGGSDTIQGNADPDTVAFGAAGQTYFVSSSGSGSDAVYWNGHTDALTGIATTAFDGGASTVVATDSGAVQLAGAGDLAFLTGAAMRLGLAGSDTVAVQRGSDTIAAAAGGGGHNLVFGDSGSQIQYAGSGSVDTIVATAATMTGAAAGVVAFGANNGSLTYSGGAGQATVIGGSASVSIMGGAGGGLFGGGSAGGNSYVSGQGAMTVFGSAVTDRVVLSNAAANVVVAGSGAEQVRASAATGGNALYAGSGSDTLAGGSGNDTLFAGAGNATLTGGGGQDYFGVIKGDAGGQVLITDWSNATDTLGLDGYGPGEVDAAAAQEQAIGGNTVLRLADNTRITFLGAENVNATRIA